MHSFIEIIGSGTHDSSCSFQLFFDEARYLFECGDGTQRLCTEFGIRHAKLRHIFLTSLSAPSVGGLLGLGLTLADAGKESLSISAPHGLSRLFTAARMFYHRPKFDCTLTEIDLEAHPHKLPLPVLEDDHITVHAVPVRSRRDKQIDTAFGAHYDAVAYVCRLRDVRGKFNPARALELGVQRGRNFGLLQNGQTVTTAAGNVVSPQDVMSPSTPGPLFVVVPCPTLDHVQSVVRSQALQPVQLGVLKRPGASPERKCVIVHLAPKDVLEQHEYRQWCDSFGTDVAHIPLHASVSPRRTVFSAQAEGLALLHFGVDECLFPLPADLFAPGPTDSSNGQVKSGSRPEGIDLVEDGVTAENNGECMSSDPVGEWINADCRLKYVLSPVANCGPNTSAIRPRFIELKANYPLMPWKESGLQQADEQEPAGNEMKTPLCVSSLPPGKAAVRFFGTGAAIPGKHRNVSSLMLDMFERGGVMMDCGEGTWGQMVRHFGLERAKRVICELKVIFISHMHADHHLGLMTLLHERTVALRENEAYRNGPQLVIIGPFYLNRWLEEFQALAKVPLQQQLPPAQRSFKFFDAAKLTDPQTPSAKFFPDAFGLEVGCVDVIHCPFSYGIVVKDRSHGWKVVYSGDTRPCAELGEMGRGATLAIHEATLDDDLKEEALSKSHCTMSEALDVCSNQMGAWRTILTHFSQRYPKIPKLDNSILNQMRKARAAIAFDLMCIDFSRLEELPQVTPALRDCFPDENPDEDQACTGGKVVNGESRTSV